MEKTKSTAARVSSRMTIGEIVTQYPEAVEPLFEAGVPCAGCGVRFDASLSESLSNQGIEGPKADEFISKLNETIDKIQSDYGIGPDSPKTIAISSRAAEKIKSLMEKQNQNGGLRFAAMPGGCSGFSYALGFENKPAPNDEIVQEKGVSFFIDKNMLSILNGCRIDYVDALQGSGFKINNPNAKNTCSCGQSFS
ncbi:MAG: iron-sulfur cluster assembly accessory protein [Candidatus Diapherotrites archaeon]|uniref:Iron-sulfur cluster assembly accessory protein n=1 Tax=Candidatus Iainarchaeum sp. TaxID=3101447 RepID=A0A8T4LG59_9ARCH|nr:iron-sulfur cluster assembly accessory protein [Candidatus Diapherotrites archaeon]